MPDTTNARRSKSAQNRLRVLSDQLGLPQFVVMERALDLLDEDVRSAITKYAEEISPKDVHPKPPSKNGRSHPRVVRDRVCPWCKKSFTPQGLGGHLSPNRENECAVLQRMENQEAAKTKRGRQ